MTGTSEVARIMKMTHMALKKNPGAGASLGFEAPRVSCDPLQVCLILGLLPRPPNAPLLRALWCVLVDIWGILKGSWGVLVLLSLKPLVPICLHVGALSRLQKNHATGQFRTAPIQSLRNATVLP